MGGSGEPLGHQGDHGPQDHGFVAGGQAFVVADGPAVLADPGEGALDHRAAGQDLEGVQVTGAPDDLDGELERAGGPGDELAGIDAVRPGQLDRGEGAAQVPQQGLCGVAVLDARGGNDHLQQQAQGVHGDVPLAPVHLFGVIPAAAGPGHGVGGADRLGVDDRGRGRGATPGRGPDLGTQRIVQPGQGAVVPPGGEVAVDGAPGREIRGQVPPGASGPVHVQDALHDAAGRPYRRPAAPAGDIFRQARGDDLPLGLGQVAGVALSPAGCCPRSLGMRGPPLVLDPHKSRSWGPRPHPARPPRPGMRRQTPIYQTLTKSSADQGWPRMGSQISGEGCASGVKFRAGGRGGR